jgi:hypothetical protein
MNDLDEPVMDDADDVVDGDDKNVTPISRLSLGSIGGLKIRSPQKRLPNLNVLVYGDSGAGKTLLSGGAAFVPELSPVLFIDVEGGTHTLSHFEDTADIDIVPDPAEERTLRWTDIQKLYNALYEGKHPYKTVVIDSLTEMQKLAMSTLLGSGDKMTIDAVGNLPEYKDWNINTEQMRRMVRAFRDLPMNTIFTALADDIADPRSAKSENPKFLKVPSFTKRLRQEIPAFFDIVLYLYSKAQGPENVRFVQTDKDNNAVAKCRVFGVPRAIQNPNMEMLYDMLVRNPAKPGSVSAQATVAATGGMKRKTMVKK